MAWPSQQAAPGAPAWSSGHPLTAELSNKASHRARCWHPSSPASAVLFQLTCVRGFGSRCRSPALSLLSRSVSLCAGGGRGARATWVGRANRSAAGRLCRSRRRCRGADCRRRRQPSPPGGGGGPLGQVAPPHRLPTTSPVSFNCAGRGGRRPAVSTTCVSRTEERSSMYLRVCVHMSR